MRTLCALACAIAAVASLAAASTSAGTARESAALSGYTYAGLRANTNANGIRATITALRAPRVASGHVAGWIGVGGPGQGQNGADAWLQAGIASTSDRRRFVYAEVTRPGAAPRLIRVTGLEVGASHRIAVLELPGRPGFWRASVDARPATPPIFLPGSTGRWAPIATAESWGGGQPVCNDFAFRFERVAVLRRGEGGWTTFEASRRFVDPYKRLGRLGQDGFVAAAACS